MKYRAYIIKNDTGEGRWYDYGECEPEYMCSAEYLWSEGNNSCDCNRALYWDRANGGPGMVTNCGDSQFSVPYIEWADGRRELIDDMETA